MQFNRHNENLKNNQKTYAFILLQNKGKRIFLNQNKQILKRKHN